MSCAGMREAKIDKGFHPTHLKFFIVIWFFVIEMTVFPCAF